MTQDIGHRRPGRARRWSGLLASGAAALLLPIVVPAGIAWADAPTPSAVELPVPLAAGPIPNATVYDVACPATGSCTAVGQYQDTIGITHAMTLNLSAGVWTSAAMLAPNNAPDYTFADLNAVSCVSVGNCVAVGDYRVSTIKTEGFYAVETSGVWARGVALPLPADASSTPAQTTFLSVGCVPGGSVCKMLGEYTTTSTVNSAVDTFSFSTGLSPTSYEIAPGAGQIGIGLDSISCVDVSTCVAVGSETSNSAEVAAFDEYKSGTWGAPGMLVNPGGAGAPSEFLSAVSCVAVGQCVAAGNWTDLHGAVFAESYTLATWAWTAPTTIAQPSNLSYPFVDDLSCAGAITTCTMVGALSDRTGALHAATAQMTNGSWGQLAPTNVPSTATPDHELLGVSCTSGNQCTAVGYYTDSTSYVDSSGNHGFAGMAATWTPGTAPGQPTALHVVASNPHAAQLAWTAPANIGSGISHYELSSQLAGHAAVDKGPTISTAAVVSGLTPGGTYTFTVTAVATDGQTSVSAPLRVSAPPTTPSAPTIVRIAGVHHGIRVQWAAPGSTGGSTITSYTVSASCAGATRTSRYGGSVRLGTVSGLAPGVRCVVRVTASNRAGASRPSGPATGYAQR